MRIFLKTLAIIIVIAITILFTGIETLLVQWILKLFNFHPAFLTVFISLIALDAACWLAKRPFRK